VGVAYQDDWAARPTDNRRFSKAYLPKLLLNFTVVGEIAKDAEADNPFSGSFLDIDNASVCSIVRSRYQRAGFLQQADGTAMDGVFSCLTCSQWPSSLRRYQCRFMKTWPQILFEHFMRTIT